MLADDLQRMEYTPNQYYNFHPGSHVKQGAEVGIAQIAETLNEVLFPEQTTTVLLETMAGKGSEVGRNFSELRAILDSVHLQEKMGVCLDTCLIWDGGYDIAECWGQRNTNSWYPEDSHVREYGYYLRYTDFAQKIGYSEGRLDRDLCLSLRKPTEGYNKC